MLHALSNQNIEIKVSSLGAELQSCKNANTHIEYMWRGDSAFWGKFSPVLFPIVGSLKNNEYAYDGNIYSLPRHGFARDKEFILVEETDSTLVFELVSDSSTLKVYPFLFKLRITYKLKDDSLSVSYLVENADTKDIYFSIGGHPAFAVPIFQNESYEDYVLKFDKIENADRYAIREGGLLDVVGEPCIDNTDAILLKKQLFEKDAIVLKRLSSTKVSLLSMRKNRGFEFDFTGFPYLGLWAAPNADFVCIEPWCGIADSINANGDFTQKEGINKLSVRDVFIRTWRFTII